MPPLVPPVPNPSSADPADLVLSVAQLVDHSEFPCVGAKATFHRRQATVRLYASLGTEAAAEAMADDLRSFLTHTEPDALFVSFVAVFRGPRVGDEVGFERLLFHQLALLSERDDRPWSAEVSSDAGDGHFGFSFHGRALFVVGLHPAASRVARRAGSPVLVFNPHQQFERLREEERFVRMRDVIRRRDRRLQGSTNPMVDDFGAGSEARQYSGRAVGPDWEPPESIGHAS